MFTKHNQKFSTAFRSHVIFAFIRKDFRDQKLFLRNFSSKDEDSELRKLGPKTTYHKNRGPKLRKKDRISLNLYL